MPRKAAVKKQEGFLSQIKWGESYTSLFLGAVVVVIALILLFSFIKAKNAIDQQTGSTSTQTEETMRPSSYVVKEGDDLWSIATKIYGSGYNWVDLAKANDLKNPNVLYVGTNLKVPNVEKKVVATVTTSIESIKGSTYTVVKGDNLWNISIRAYGDGYKWVEIARANKLTHPDLIYPGDVFNLPR